MSFTKSYPSFLQSKPWLARMLFALLFFIILLSLVRLSLPFVIKFGATYWFETQGVEINIGEIDISLSDASFAVHDVSAKNKMGKVFSLGIFSIGWQWQPLRDHLAIVDQIEVNALNIDAKLFDNGDMNIAGLVIKATSDKSPPEIVKQSVATPWDVTVKNIVLSNVELCVQQFSNTDKLILDYCGRLANLDWAGNASFRPSIQLETSDVPPLFAQGTLNMQGIVLQNNPLNLALLKIGSIDIKNISIDTPSNISINNLGVTGFSMLQRAGQTSPGDAQVFSFDTLNIQPLKLSQLNKLSLGVIELTDASAYLLIDKQGRMDFEQWQLEKQQEVASKQKESPKTSNEAFHFDFDEFIFISSQHFIFIDDSLKETFAADIHDINLRLTQLDSSAPDNLSKVSLALVIDNHGIFKLDADINPLSHRPSLKGKGEISGLDLRMIAPMTKQYIGHNVKSGQLDADLKLDIDKGLIDSNMGLALHQFELESLSKEEAEELNSEFGFPLNSSLSLIRDRDNTIRLDIPITGDIDNPEFDPKDAIVKASSTAITAAVIQYYTPFGLVFAAEALFDLATALNFDPVLFEAGETVLNVAHKEQLDKLSALMIERPGIHLTLCGISNNLDRGEIFPELVKIDKTTQEEKSEVKPVSKENIIVLKKLADSRSTNTKNYMVNEKDIEASRLIECSPEYVEDEIAGVEISI